MSKFKPNKNVKFSRKHIQRGERALDKLKLNGAEKARIDEINTKLHSAINAITYFIQREDYDSIKELGKGIKDFAIAKWKGYIDPTIWTKEEHKYMEEQFDMEIKFDDHNLGFDADAFTNVEFIKHEGQKEIKYWVLTSCSFMEGYNDPMTSKYFDPTDLVAAKQEFKELIVIVEQDIKMNIAYIKKQTQDLQDALKKVRK